MKACVYEEYGSADVVSVEEVPTPTPAPGELLVKVGAASVTTADWRFRTASFPTGFALAGRLVVGIFGPRHPVLGMDFAGEVAKVGAGVTGFAVGDRVFGAAARGAHAEYVTVRADGAVAHTPSAVSDVQAAAIPFGGCTSLAHLRGFAAVRPGQRVLVLGASGGVGAWAVQVARHLGAEVTGVASTSNLELVRSLGATRALDYTTGPYLAPGDDYDLVVDTVGASRFADVRPALARHGAYLPITATIREVVQSITTRFGGGPRVLFGISGNTRPLLEELADLVADGTLRPVVDQVFTMDRVADAHRRVEGRHKRGAVILQMAPPTWAQSPADGARRVA